MITDKSTLCKLLSIVFLGLSTKLFAATTNGMFLSSTPTHPNHWSIALNALKNAHTKKSIQLGGFVANQGKSQNININGLIGDHFSVTRANDSNGLVGIGYYFDGQETKQLNLSYGLNAFYLAKTGVNGLVTQEQLFTNLSYHYSTTNYPIYFGAKAQIKKKTDDKYNVTLDTGIGPNIITTSSVNETSLDGITIPDRTYSGRTTAAFSAMVGAGIRMNNVFGRAPLECGYRFFYLGQGHFNKLSNQIVNTLSTGNSYSNALLCALIL